MSFFPSQNTPKLMLALASPQTPLGELTALPQTLGFKGAASWQERNGGEGKRRRVGKGGMGKGGERGRVRGIAPWLLGG